MGRYPYQRRVKKTNSEAANATATAAPKSKYKAKKTTVILPDGTEHTFDSRKEARVYAGLAERERNGEISNIQFQVPFVIIPKQRRSDGYCERACKYLADFVYEENGTTKVVDAKGFRTDVYKIKKKLMLYMHGIEIEEV